MKSNDVDGFYIIEQFLLTKGEHIVKNGRIPFKPLIDFGLIVYNQKANATNRLKMKFDLERFFMRRCAGELSGVETQYVKVPDNIYNRVKELNDGYRLTKVEE